MFQKIYKTEDLFIQSLKKQKQPNESIHNFGALDLLKTWISPELLVTYKTFLLVNLSFIFKANINLLHIHSCRCVGVLAYVFAHVGLVYTASVCICLLEVDIWSLPQPLASCPLRMGLSTEPESLLVKLVSLVGFLWRASGFLSSAGITDFHEGLVISTLVLRPSACVTDALATEPPTSSLHDDLKKSSW